MKVTTDKVWLMCAFCFIIVGIMDFFQKKSIGFVFIILGICYIFMSMSYSKKKIK